MNKYRSTKTLEYKNTLVYNSVPHGKVISGYQVVLVGPNCLYQFQIQNNLYRYYQYSHFGYSEHGSSRDINQGSVALRFKNPDAVLVQVATLERFSLCKMECSPNKLHDCLCLLAVS